ncbi:hypothetical protein CEUSTIGMA_g1251.t1 [Chlamydomonas eustigma]|uniref:CRM domain-containing protein n=1 Tax=Chlamydomonas eustigma TaxID=1157962 RepID=A0A250WTF2_9CHLO|nr:hypothetical protein CEUSTIGMA_g1251.t1 [Chlamydomonas eustigma]|eukprot:GAX73800.1 hypothetical protein CEUSTIGMA_g1251.t1 [Chlamydomonas eustigma]
MPNFKSDEPLIAGDKLESRASPSRTYFEEKEEQLLWDAVSRPLLKVGSSGALDTHIRSMRELLTAHKLVKVQLNNDPKHAHSVARMFEEECNAKLVAIRGKTILMAEGATSDASLLAIAETSRSKIRRYNEKRRLASQGSDIPGSDDSASSQGAHPREERTWSNASLRADRREGTAPLSSTFPTREGPGDRSLQRGSQRKGESGPDINDLISVSLVRGPITKESLRKEWGNLAEKIQKVEAQEENGQVPLNPARRKQIKAPWRRQTS